MIYKKIEGKAPRNGLNVYWNDMYSSGFILRLGCIRFQVRYSKLLARHNLPWFSRWHIGFLARFYG